MLLYAMLKNIALGICTAFTALIVLVPFANAADIRFEFSGAVNQTALPEVAQVGDLLEIVFVLPDNPQNVSANPAIAFRNPHLFGFSAKINGTEVFVSETPNSLFFVNTDTPTNPHTASWSASFNSLFISAFMAFPDGFFPAFPSVNDVLDTSLPEQATVFPPRIEFCIEVFNCVSAPIEVYSFETLVVDVDGDGVADDSDNCLAVSNPIQLDSDADGFGNACDPDVDNNCVVNFLDVSAFSSEFLGSNPLFDFDTNGFVNLLDFAVMANAIFMEPGPSAVGSCD